MIRVLKKLKCSIFLMVNVNWTLITRNYKKTKIKSSMMMVSNLMIEAFDSQKFPILLFFSDFIVI